MAEFEFFVRACDKSKTVLKFKKIICEVFEDDPIITEAAENGGNT